jgi:hypothetical protein
MSILDPKLVHLGPEIGPNNSKNISIQTGWESWPRRTIIIHFLLCFPDIFHFLGQIGPKMSILDPKSVHLGPEICPNYSKNTSIQTGLKSWLRTTIIIHFW